SASLANSRCILGEVHDNPPPRWPTPSTEQRGLLPAAGARQATRGPRRGKRGEAMDAFCVGRYRSCSTWQYAVTSHLLERHRGGQRLGYLSGEEFDRQEQGPTPAWRVLKSHEGHPVFAAALAAGRARSVYAYRDLRDVAFSLAHKFSTSFEEVV